MIYLKIEYNKRASANTDSFIIYVKKLKSINIKFS